jgi:hypothetical protein
MTWRWSPGPVETRMLLAASALGFDIQSWETRWEDIRAVLRELDASASADVGFDVGRKPCSARTSIPLPLGQMRLVFHS